jgi:hypothetical protein
MMPKIVVTASVRDVQAWLEWKTLMVPRLAGVASDGSSYVAADGSNHVATTWDVPDMAAFQAAQATLATELAAEMERGAMIPPVMIYTER